MKIKKILVFSLFCMFLLNMQCDEDDVVVIPCGLEVIIDNTAYLDAEAQTIENVTIEGDCITLNISNSGCDASTWVMTLIDSEDISESMPSRRFLKLSLFNNEACLAVFSKEESFDLLPLRINGVNEVLLNIEGLEEPILYTY